MLLSTGNGFPPLFNERKSPITSKRLELQRKHVQKAKIKSRSPNRLVTLLLFCNASIHRKWISGIVSEMTVTINTETIEFTEETYTDCLYKAAIAESNCNVRLEVQVANSVH
jgi:hypothetical protein